ncbi:predicted nucleoside-diphosphate-sugar epimerase [Erythrobacter sp. NAP1]|uniref:NAD-dependent epimerase/dehydratase family protein n=1 Tax=Erythrobacter sp. NAP1 TaxID=237727 RepID=UPI0000686EEC|nr:NAD(P)H-binding protein [Erythrobacter sp. NAP1]EAQ29318.1 predicted nucleoside-diphosphate-sugar epimerase [Erythrobacter sp. NAP1]
MPIVAITGATGFVGKATLDVAVQKGLHVRALTRRDAQPRERVTWVPGTLDRAEALEELVSGCDAVIHVAGLTSTPNPGRFEAANVTGTANMIAAAKSQGIERFVFVSSLSAREPDLSAYGASKAKAERLVEDSGLDWTIVRPPGVYGPGDKDYLDLFKAAKLGIVPVPPEGKSSLIHVEDLARLLVALVPVNPVTRGQTYEPWDDNAFGYTHKELAEMIGEAVGNPRATAVSLPPAVMKLGAQVDGLLRGGKAKLTQDRVGYMLHDDWVCDLRKAPPLSIWQAVWGGEAGLAMTAQWYKEQGWL